MKIRKVIIRKKSLDQFYSEMKKDIKGPVKRENIIYVEDINTFNKVFTKERIRLIRAIHKYAPKSTYELAKTVRRDRKNVITDLDFLENAGLIELRQERGKRPTVRPVADYDMIDIKIEI